VEMRLLKGSSSIWYSIGKILFGQYLGVLYHSTLMKNKFIQVRY